MDGREIAKAQGQASPVAQSGSTATPGCVGIKEMARCSPRACKKTQQGVAVLQSRSKSEAKNDSTKFETNDNCSQRANAHRRHGNLCARFPNAVSTKKTNRHSRRQAN